MITADGWFDWMERRPGPAWKVNGGVNPASLYLPHSAVGDLYSGWAARLFSNQRVSIHGWIEKDGRAYQHYPVTARCWGSGAGYPNDNGVAFENAGGRDTPATVSEPLTEGQIAANVRIIQDLSIWLHQPISRWRRPLSATDLAATLYEHRECTRFGADPTACPSGRVPWAEILRRLVPQEDDGMIFTRHNGHANPVFWDGLEFQGEQLIWARSDFNLPQATRLLVRYDIWLDGGVLDVTDHDGSFAGSVGGGAGNRLQVEAWVDDGWGRFFSEFGCRVHSIGITGFWR